MKDEHDSRKSYGNLPSAKGSPVSERRKLLKFTERQKEPPSDLSL